MARLLSKTGLLDTGQLVPGSITALGTVTSGTISTGAVIDDPTMTQGSDATGDVYYRAADGKLTRLATTADGHVLTSTGAGAVPAWEAGAAAGYGNNVQIFRLNADVTGSTSPLLGWEKEDGVIYGSGVIATGGEVTEGATVDGVFEIPVTGIWLIQLTWNGINNGALGDISNDNWIGCSVYAMIDPGGWNVAAFALSSTANTANHDKPFSMNASCSFLYDVTVVGTGSAASQVKVFWDNENAADFNKINGSTTINYTTLMFMRLGDT